jgi:streptogramin lyase
VVGNIAGIAVKGRYNDDQWVKTFKVQSMGVTGTWTYVEDDKVFTGNSDRDTQVNVTFAVPVEARYVRIYPQSWNEYVSLRAEIIARVDGTFVGAATTDDGRVVFAPYQADGVAVFDHLTNTVSMPAPGQFTTNYKQAHAAKAGNGLIVFAPANQSNIMVFDPETNASRHLQESVYNNTVVEDAYRGAAATNDGKVVFAPYDSEKISVYDPFPSPEGSVRLIDVGQLVSGSVKYACAAKAGNGKIVFCPAAATNVGVFDPEDDSFTTVPIPNDAVAGIKFEFCDVLPDGRVVFSPMAENSVGSSTRRRTLLRF